MTQREKILAGLVLGGAAIFVGIFAFRGLVLKPVEEVDKQIAAVQAKLHTINKERQQYFAAETKLNKIGQTAFGFSPDEAAARSAQLLTKRLREAGLNEAEFTRIPVGPRRLRGASEIGWSVQGKGKFENVLDLLYFLQESPFLSRVENVVISDSETLGVVKVRFRFLTLTFDPAPPVELTEPAAIPRLADAKRRHYQLITQRDLLSPYIKAPPPKVEPQPTNPTPDSPPGPDPANFKVVSLSQWNGQPEAHIRNLKDGKTSRLKPGDEFLNATLAGVDYRPRPAKSLEGLLSHSRVILRIDGAYWAIERGDTFADKYQMKLEDLPSDLVSSAD